MWFLVDLRGLMDKASASGAGDSGFESRRGCTLFVIIIKQLKTHGAGLPLSNSPLVQGLVGFECLIGPL